MKKCISIFILLVFCTLLFTGCGCRHEWFSATCIAPKTCSLCGLTEGEATGHTWEEATCIVPKKCSTCHQTEGEALSHNWEEATTEAPKTCTNCQATDGSKLQTDPRFTTAATKHLQGIWSCDVVLTGDLIGIPGYFESLPCTLVYEFGKTGELIVSVELHDNLAYLEELKRMIADIMYESLAAQGIGKSYADAAMQEVYGMNMTEYVNVTVESMDMDDIFGNFTHDGVYYVGQNGIYISDSWYGTFECSAYTLEDGVLIIEDDVLEEGGDPLEWTRVEEN